ncbi:hypothetical protein OAE19_01685 [Porticoccaceae bacterium]|nr:hypothetical protein [Porticoccaceae bacterium]
MIDLTKYFDPYERKARAYPALLILLPLAISLSFNYPDLYSSLTGLVVLFTVFGGLHLLAHVSRDLGKRLELKLYDSWGGMPSIGIFRYSDAIIPRPAKAMLHDKLCELTGIETPGSVGEKSAPEEADEIYRSWSDYLRTNARDIEKYNLLFAELINYGFRRNVYGMKYFYSLGGILSLCLFSLSGVEITQIEIGVMLAIAGYTIFFTLMVNSEWVRVPAIEYAKRLIETITN